MGCEANRDCCMGECAGHCKDDAVSINEVSLNTIVELEIHYSVSTEAEILTCVFEGLYCLTNIQTKELRLTGLEGNRYEDLELMKLQVVDFLMQKDKASCESLKNADIVYVRDDV